VFQFGAPAGDNDDAVKDMIAQGLPVVCVDREFVGVEADTIVVDNHSAAKTIVQHLIALGHRRIAVLRARLRANSINDRVNGYLEALAEFGLRAEAGDIAESASDVDDACRIAIEILHSDRRPDAIFCTNNFMTLGAMRAISETELRCPADIAVAGIDDLPWTAGFRPRLTVIAQPGRAMGREGARLLLDRIAKRRTDAPVRWVLPTELRVRESCGANNRR
jgi:LacI family transcriptional regulator